MSLTAERLKKLLFYEPATGCWTWISKTASASHMKPGDRAGCPDPKGYVRIRIDGKYYKGHRLAVLYMTGEWPPALVDHRNRNPEDGAYENLRPATRSQNRTNSRTYASSRLKGVYRRHRGKTVRFEVYLTNPRTFIGYFQSPIEAAIAYDVAAKDRHGDFAALNLLHERKTVLCG